jgi:uncharacterized protein (DUF302 family)
MSKTVTFTDQDGCNVSIYKTHEGKFMVSSNHYEDTIDTELEKTEVIELISILIKLVTEE